MVDTLFQWAKSLTSKAANVTTSIASETVHLTSDAVHGVKKGVKFTTQVANEMTKLTTDAVKETARLTSSVMGKTLEMINLKDLVVRYIRLHVLGYSLQEEKLDNLKKAIIQNAIFTCAQFVISPIERVRILIQNQHLFLTPDQYVGAWDCFFKESRKNGIISLFRGAFPMTMYHLLRYNLRNYRLKTILSKYIESDEKRFIDICNLMKNCFLWDLGLLVVSQPLELFAIQLSATSNYQWKYYINKKLALPQTIFTGFSANLSMLALNYLIMTPLIHYLGRHTKDLLQLFFYLGGSMLATEFLTYPLEQIKRRMMFQHCSQYDGKKYPNLISAFRTIYNEEHISGLYKGAWLKFLIFGLRKGLLLGMFKYDNV